MVTDIGDASCREGVFSALDPRGFLGLTLFLAWFNCTFFSCLLVTNLCMSLSSERYWGLAMLAAAITQLIILIVHGRRRLELGGIVVTIAAGAMCAVGTLFLYLGFYFDELIYELIITGAVISGVSMSILILKWVEEVKSRPRAFIELIVPASYAASIVIYFVLVYTKTPLAVGAVIALPALSSFLLANTRSESGIMDDSPRNRPWPAGLMRSLSRESLALLALWMNFAYFRSFTAPDYPSNRLTHYLIPFSLALIVSIIIFFWIYKSASSITMTLAYRIALPLIVVGYTIAPLLHGKMREFAFTLSFAAMIIIQLYLWIVPIKQAQRHDLDIITPISSIIISTGIGSIIGIILGLATRVNLEPELRLTIAPLMGAFVIIVLMFTGFSPHSLTARFKELERSEVDGRGYSDQKDGSQPDPYDIGNTTRSELLAHEYDLTSRESEVLTLLLQGRDRPRMRDELQISVNTVSTHIRNIYRKLEVNDRQELIDLSQETVDAYLDETE